MIILSVYILPSSSGGVTAGSGTMTHLGSLLYQLLRIDILRRVNADPLVLFSVFHRGKVSLLRTNTSCLDEVLRNSRTLSSGCLKLDDPLLGRLIICRRLDLHRRDNVEVELGYISPYLLSQFVSGEEVRRLKLFVVSYGRTWVSDWLRCSDIVHIRSKDA